MEKVSLEVRSRVCPPGDVALDCGKGGSCAESGSDWFGFNRIIDSLVASVTQGPDSGEKRVLRGGYWDATSSFCRFFVRAVGKPDESTDMSGFRLVRIAA